MRARGVCWAGSVLMALGCVEQSTSPEVERSPLINGDILTPDAAVNVPVIRFSEKFDPNDPDKIREPLGSGVLVGPTLVLTAAHGVKHIDLSTVEVQHGRDETLTTANPILALPHLSFERRGANGRIQQNPDLALVVLDKPLDGGLAPLAELDCDPQPVLERTPKLHCVSGVSHTLRLFPPPETDANPFINDALFDVKPSVRSGLTNYGPNAPRPPERPFFQSFEVGDSGMGCFLPGIPGVPIDPDNPDTIVVTSIHQGHDNAPPIRRMGGGTEIAPFCDWLRPYLDDNRSPRIGGANKRRAARVLERPPAVATELHLDSDNKRDIARLTRVDGDDLSLTLERTQFGDQTFPVSIPGADDISGITIGNFTGQGQTLAIIADGALRTVSFNKGPQPTISGATGTDYVMLAKARMNGGNIDDLVAQRENGQIDVFIGGSSGLQLNAGIKPEPLDLNDDLVTDFAWLTGGAGLSTSNSIPSLGQSFRDVVPNTITLSDIRTGLFHRGTGAGRGGEDVVVLGKDTNGGGVVIWCTSNGNGVVCHEAIEARFASGRNPIGIEVDEVSGDDLKDLIVTYDDGTPQQLFLGEPAGFHPLVDANDEPASVLQVVPLFLGSDLVAVTIDDDGGNIIVGTRDIDSNELAVLDTGIPFAEPVIAKPGNFNADGVLANALADGQSPLEDLAIVSGGRVFALIADGSGGFSLNPLNTPSDVISIATNDVTGDGIDDLSATRADRSVTVFAGSPSGLVATAENFTGLPTPDGNDGKMLMLSGQGVDTVGTAQMRMRLRVGPGDTAALDHLNVQVFDGNNSGLHQFDEDTNLLKTCYRLSADPCGDGNSGNCAGGPIQPIPLVTVSSDTLGDDKWDSIFNGPHSAQASLTGNGQPPFTYELRVYLSPNCANIPAAGSQVAVATADAFKIRSNAMVSQPLGEFSIVGSDSSGPFGVPNLPYMRDTDYDGTFNLPISVSSSATEIQLKESDADDTQDTTPGVSLGANAQIQYRLLKPDGTAANLTGADDPTPTALVTNPSGDNNGQTALDVETRKHTISGSGAGVWTWQWQNVKASNAIHLFSPFGSPTTHEVMGAWRERTTVSTAQQPSSWRSDVGALQAELPIVLGNAASDEQLEGTALLVDSASRAQTILDNAGNDLHGELERQLLTAKLNWQHGLTLGEDIKGALVYGRTKAVRAVLNEADNVVSGIDGLAGEARVRDLVALLSAINLGELNYQQPGVPFPDEPMADDDSDGIANMKDNCPSIANAEQQDSDDDWIGDACHVTPLPVCVLERSQTEREAVFGYDNPLKFRGIPQGTKNVLAYNGQTLWETAQPTELAGGSQLDAFRYTIARGDTLSWTLDGTTVTIDDATSACSGRELASVGLAPQTALYGAEGVVLGERSSVVSRAGGLSSVVSGADVVLEASSSAGNVLAAGRVIVRDYGAIRGAAATTGGVERVSTALVTEALTFVPRPHSLAWWVEFKADGLTDVTVGATGQRALEPGDYGDVVVASRGQLLLSAGRYRFRSLVVLKQGSVRIDGGEVVVHLQNRLEHAGDTRLASGARLVLGYLGTEPAAIDASLQAVVVAPNAELTIGSVRQSVYIGSFAAKRLVVRPETQVEYAGAGG